MRAKYLALCLSLFTLSIPLHAASVTPSTPPITKQEKTSEKINLNNAALSKLIGSFKGIGKKRAEAIITYRESHKGFKSLEELASVKGFSQHFLDVNRDKLQEVFTVS